METKNGNDLSGVVLYRQALDAIIELSNTTQEYFKQHAALIDYKLLMADSNLEDAFCKLCSVNGSLLGMDVVKDIPDQYHKTRHALEEIMRNARTKQECFASYFKSTIETLGLAETRDKLNARLITIKSVGALLEDGISSSSPEDNSDPDWSIVKEHYEDTKKNRAIIAIISGLKKLIDAEDKARMYDHVFLDDERDEFIKLLRKASGKFDKAKLEQYQNNEELKQLPSDLFFETSLAVVALSERIWKYLNVTDNSCGQSGNLQDFCRAIRDLDVEKLRNDLKKFLIEMYVEEGGNG